jgi:hypothetical protein
VDGDFHAGMAAAHEAVRQYRLKHGTVPDAESGSDEDETSSGPDETEPDPEPACGYDAAWHEEAEAIAAWLEQIGCRWDPAAGECVKKEQSQAPDTGDAAS